jgi:hypothetical protein
MSFEELLQEHIKALNENTKALVAHTNALNVENKSIAVEHTKDSACKFCGVTYKTMQHYIECGNIVPSRKPKGKREYFKESDLVALCDAKKLYAGDYGQLRSNPRSLYYGR